MQPSKFNVRRKLAGMVAAAVLLSGFPVITYGKPRPPGPPLPEIVLQQWSFDAAYYASIGTSGVVPINPALWAESWSGYALARSTRTVFPFVIPVATTNRWNLTPDQGSIRVWFSPGWTTATSRSTGPGQKATILDLSLISGSSTLPVWSLYATANGASLNLDAQGDGGLVNILGAGITWNANQWHLITISYSGTETLLYLDNTLVSTGAALPVLPLDAAAATGQLTVGSSPNGSFAAQGLFDELTTLPQQIKASALCGYYEFRRPTVDLGPITLAEEQALQQKFAQAKAAAQSASASMSLLSAQTMSPMQQQYTTNLYLLSPQVLGTNITLTLVNANPSKSYDIQSSPVLLDSNTLWLTTIPGAQGQTNFFTVMTQNIQFYQATESGDWDRDGIPNYLDPRPYDGTISNLVITIERPANGTNIVQ